LEASCTGTNALPDHLDNPAPEQAKFADHLRTLHTLLDEGDWAFGHRVFYEAVRFAAMLAVAGAPALADSLDRQVLQKILPRLHGNRRRLEPTLCALGLFCYDLSYDDGGKDHVPPYNALNPLVIKPILPLSFAKVQRMLRSLRINQFASFTE
jgi:5-methylcytosine-specific restriction protein B